MSRREIEEAIALDDRDRLRIAVLSVALHSPDFEWAERLFFQLAQHDDPGVRGNAVLGFGHLARLHGRLTETIVRPVIEAALDDADEFVKGQANSAADDVEFFLKWRLVRR